MLIANLPQRINHRDRHTEQVISAGMMQKLPPVIYPVQELLSFIKGERKPSVKWNRETTNSRKIKNMIRKCKFVWVISAWIETVVTKETSKFYRWLYLYWTESVRKNLIRPSNFANSEGIDTWFFRRTFY